LYGKESQEGRQESYQKGQVTRARIQLRLYKGAAATCGAFFFGVPSMFGSLEVQVLFTT
jgi:VIT1/CCC1 family predicted Fe2+/Mn2+ transporter